MRFDEYYYIEERNKHKDSYLPITKKLEKFKDDDDVYISFTNVPKLGINPKTRYNTPAGIYTYPVKAMWYDIAKWKIPFQGDAPYVQVLRHTRNGKYIEDISQLGQKEFKDNVDKLEKFFKEKLTDEMKKVGTYSEEWKQKLGKMFLELLKKTESEANNNSYGGVLFYFVNILAQRLKNYLPTKSFTTNQTYIWRKVLGYNMVADKSGEGIIHPSEPLQAVFFDNTAYKHIDTFENKKYENLHPDINDVIKNGTYTKNDDGTYTVEGKVVIKTPFIPFKFKKVTKSFVCENKKLTSLKGAPKEVGGIFDCSGNQLKSLEGAPEKVGGWFDCSNNRLTSLKGAPEKVGGSFDCSENKLTSLKGAPEKVGGSFDCSENKLTSLEGAPEEVNGSFNCYRNKLTSLKGAPEEVTGGFDCHINKLISLEGAPKEVSGFFDCHINKLTSLEGAPEKVGDDFICDDNKIKFTKEDIRKVSNVKGKIYV